MADVKHWIKDHAAQNIPLAFSEAYELGKYVLSGSSIGYILLEHFATNIIPDMLGFGRKMAISLFEFGRALQCSLSARFRIKTDFEKASLLYNLSCDHCRMFLYLNSEIS